LVVDDEERRRPAFWSVFCSVTSFVSGFSVVGGKVVVVVAVGVDDGSRGRGRVELGLGFLRMPARR
jgi:hypothetical protein